MPTWKLTLSFMCLFSLEITSSCLWKLRVQYFQLLCRVFSFHNIGHSFVWNIQNETKNKTQSNQSWNTKIKFRKFIKNLSFDLPLSFWGVLVNWINWDERKLIYSYILGGMGSKLIFFYYKGSPLVISIVYEFYFRAKDFYQRHIEELHSELVICRYKLNARWPNLPDQRNRHNLFG